MATTDTTYYNADGTVRPMTAAEYATLYGTSGGAQSNLSTQATGAPVSTVAATGATPAYSAAMDPYVRNMALGALNTGLSSGNLVATDAYSAEADRRAALAREGVLSSANAQMEIGMRETENLYQKAGKLASSGATRAMLNTSELYNTTTQGNVAQAELAAREAVANERNQQVATITGAATDLYTTETSAATAATEQQSEEELAWAQLGQNQAQFEASLSSEEKLTYATLNSSEQLRYAEIKAGLEMNALDNATSRQNFVDELAWAKEKGLMDDAQARDLAANALAEHARQYDHTSTIQTQQFADSLAWAKEQGYMDDATTRELAANAILEQARQYDASSELGWAQFAESCRQFDISQSLQYDLAVRSLAIQAQSADSADLSVRLQAITDVMANPLAQHYFVDGQMDILGEMIITMVDPDSEITTTDESGNLVIDWSSVSTVVSDLTKGLSDGWKWLTGRA